MAHNIYKPLSAQKFRIALRPAQYEMLKSSLVAYMHFTELTFEEQVPYMELFQVIDKMIQSIPGRVPDSALLSDEAKVNPPINASTLGFSETEVANAATVMTDEAWEKIEADLNSK